jgi:uncharacterized repeat protein (TIGR03803 family)
MQSKIGTVAARLRAGAMLIALSAVLAPLSAAAAEFAVIHRFRGPDGANALSRLIFGADANTIYGTTYNGGAENAGTIFSLTRQGNTDNWDHEVLHSFSSSGGGRKPIAGLVRSGQFLYGTTTNSPQANGAAFSFHPTKRQFRIIYSFDADPDRNGSHAQARLHVWNGRLFGALSQGGRGGGGSIYELSRPDTPGDLWTLRLLQRFNGRNGFNAAPGFIMDRKGNIFGNTYAGGPGNGVVYSLTRSAAADSWEPAVLSFFRGQPDGEYPYGELLMAGPHELIGVTNRGGANNVGTVFRLTRKDGRWTRQTVLSFPYVAKGPAYMYGGLTMDSQGNYYGASTSGGAFDKGCVFRLSPPLTANGPWRMTLLYHFRTQQGTSPKAPPLVDESTGKVVLYGTTESGSTG